MSRIASLDIPGPAGRLEAILLTPDEDPQAAGVICHAHPLQGGTMHFKVVFPIARSLRQSGLAALRFNFRGVGRSEGVHDQGRGEQEDARAALDVLESRYPGRVLLIGGFSFGSVVALGAGAGDARVGAAFALGFPAEGLADATFLARWRKPLLFIQGERDEFGRPETIGALSPGAKLEVIAGGDHFFTGRLDLVESALGAWLASRPWLDSQREAG